GIAAASLRQAGEQIAQHGVPAQRIPSCADCHGPTSRPRRAAYPVLAGQPAAYLARQLRLFAADRRGGSTWAHLMLEFAGELRPEQIEAVAAYYSSLRNEEPDRQERRGRPKQEGQPGQEGQPKQEGQPG